MDFLPGNCADQINLLHSFIVGPVLLYTGYKLNTNQLLSNIEKLVLLVMGCVTVLYHGYKSVTAQQAGESIFQNYDYQINMLHFLFIGPLIGWCGYKLYAGRNVTDL